jgi:minor extracellular serine protease Vpr
VAGLGTLWLVAVLAAPVVRGAEVRATRLPRIAGKADLQLWRHVLSNRMTFSGTRRPLFVRATTPEALASLRQLGVKTELWRWRMVRFDDAKILAAIDAGLGLEMSSARAHRPLLERSIVEIGADKVIAGKDVEMARTGKGVLVGIIDTGIDLFHPAFRDSRGRSRVVATWDQDASGSGPDGFDYGRECDSGDIANDDCAVRDFVGHGTHVAGIAAGGRLSGETEVAGIARDADIAVVRSDNFTRLADAVEYLVNLAEKRDQPLVINISVGGQYGPHDGRTPLEEFLADVVGPGRIIVAAAGNDAAAGLHMGADLKSTPARFRLEDLPIGRPTDVAVEMWTRPETNVKLALVVVNGGRVVAEAPLEGHSDEMLDGIIKYNGINIVGFSYGVDGMTGHDLAERTVLLDMSVAGAWPADTHLELHVSGSGRIDGWISQDDYRYGTPRLTPTSATGGSAPGDNGYATLTVPATAPKVLTVGAYTVRTWWTAEDGSRIELSGGERDGKLAGYSSRGPTLSPELTGVKPDICAPGSVIDSARSIELSGASSNNIDDFRMMMQGTSMAAPHVTGIVALMLEANPDLGPVNARRYLQYTARNDENTAEFGPLPNNAWGYGKVDAAAAVRLAEYESSGCAALSPTAWLVLVGLAALMRRRLRTT